jgi:predicted acetyltransferase
MPIEIRAVGPERHIEMIGPITTTMGIVPVLEHAERMKQLPELDERFAAFDGETIVASSGAYSVAMTTPGGRVDAAGLTMVAVMSTHRRQGILTSLMHRHLGAARDRKKPVSALWASEGAIYGRFGYGMASLCGDISIEKDRSAFARPLEPAGRMRIVGEDEALRLFPPIWDRARSAQPGMLSRSEKWWLFRRLYELEWQRKGAGLLQRVVLEIDGKPEAYALYRFQQKIENDIFCGTVRVSEAIGATPLATRLIWRYLFDIDLAARIEAAYLPVDHPLLFLLADPRRLRYALHDGLWLRIVDVQAAIAGRSYGTGESVVLDIEDSFCPWNAGRFRIDGGSATATRTDAAPDLRMDVSSLGSVYLGGFSFSQLANAGRVEELREGALARGDALFHSTRGPWCPELF